MADPGSETFFTNVQRRWRRLVAAFGAGGALALVIGGLLAARDGELRPFGLGVLAGVAFVLLVLGVQVVFFPNQLTRDVRRQERRTTRLLPFAIVFGAIGAIALDFVPTYANVGAAGTLFLCIALWRTWWEKSDYARRRWVPGSN
jgi:hypothetical protein